MCVQCSAWLYATLSLAVLLLCGDNVAAYTPVARGRNTGFSSQPVSDARVDAHRGDSLVSDAVSNEGNAPGLEVAARQSLFDYGAAVGLDALDLHVRQIAIPAVSAVLKVPLIGDVHVRVSDIQCIDFAKPDASATRLLINSTQYVLHANGTSASFSYTVQWKAGPLSGTEDGTVSFLDGDIFAEFKLYDEGQVLMDLRHSSIAFADIRVHISGKLSFLYNALLGLFHDQVAATLNAAMARALQNEVPKNVNAYLSDIPVQIIVKGLPFWAAFRYSVHTDRFVMVKAFPSVVRGVPSDTAPWFDESAQDTEPAKAQVRRMLSALPRRAAAHAAAAVEASTNGAADAAHSERASFLEPPPTQECPMQGKPLNVSRRTVLSDHHMVTGYLSDSVLRCILWALYEDKKLVTTVRDGDIPGVRLLSDMFALLLPGVNKDYPHSPMRLHLAATARPNVTFSEHDGVVAEAEYESHVYVVPNDDSRSDASLSASASPIRHQDDGGDDDEGVEVAVLSTRVALKGDIAFDKSTVSHMDVKCSVVRSKYKVPTAAWDATLRYVVSEAQASWGLSTLYEQFVTTKLTNHLRLYNVDTGYYDGWYRLSTDVRVQNI